MAIVTGELYKGFTFGDVSSKDYGVYITQEAAYNAPDRDVEVVEIAGRNGAYILDKGRFRNITVSYKCGIALDDEQSFESAIRTFRNALASKAGKYVRLEDEYNPNEYRQAAFLGGIEVDMADRRAGEFTVSFDCQPQRFLKSGENPRTIGGSVTNTQTESGSVVSIESDGGDKVTSLIAQIEPVQSGSGDPSPTNVRPITGRTAANVNVAGKNLLYHIYPSQTINGVEFVLRDDGTVVANGTATANAEFSLTYRISGTYSTTRLPHGEYIITGCPSGGGSSTYEIGINTTKNGSGVTMARDYGNGATFTMDSNALIGSWITIRRGVTVNNLIFKPMVRLASETDDTYEPYKGTTYPVSFGSAGTVYGGTVDVVTGTLTLTHKSETFNGTESWGSEQTSVGLTNYYLNLDVAGKMAGRQGGFLDDELLCNWLAPSSSITTYGVYVGATSKFLNCKCQSASDVTSFKSMLSATPLVVVYPLATPQTYQLTAQQVELLTGQNHVWADTGNITLTYGADPYKVVNPTLFESKPLLQVTGRGTLSVGDVTMTITGTASQVLYIDCDIMEVYSITDGQMQPQNSLVTMNSYDFPKLKPGANKITLGVGITQVVVTPRWWRV